MRLFYHRGSSASMRVTLYLRCRGVPASLVELVSTGFETGHRDIPVFTMPRCDITLADCFPVPQIRSALLAGIDLPREFPVLARIWENAIAVPEVASMMEEAGGIVQPFAFDADKFEVYATLRGPGPSAGEAVQQ